MIKRRLLSLTGVVAGMILGMGVLTLGGSVQAQENEIEARVASAVAAWNAGDAEGFMSHLTEDGLVAFFGPQDDWVGFLTEEMEATGPIASAEVENLRLSGGAFYATVNLQFEAGFSSYEEWEFIQSSDGWVINNTTPAQRPLPPGVPVVDMELGEYYFDYNKAAINAADGNVAFAVTNVGEEEHEIVVLELTGDKSILEVLESADPESEDIPEGVEFVGFGGFFAPGSEGTAVFDQPFAPGKYALVCFVPSPEGVPHFVLGMVSEFEVSGGLAPAPTATPGTPGGGITPPSTGDAGLLDSNGSAVSWLVMSLALTLVLGGTVGLVKSR